jgi:tetratricopeptide (TPR) repeat protein
MSEAARPTDTQETGALPEAGEWVAERFQIIRVIGRGGFGMVYEARQKSMGHRRVALKILAPRRAHEPNAAERFEQEALLASRLRHPNTITLFDFGATARGLFYIAMELLEGETLNEALRRGAMPLERAEKITRQMLGSLAEAHSLGMIHRDLKPDNVFLCRIFGETDLVKVLDFGLAKLEGDLDERPATAGSMILSPRTDLTQEGLVCGTPDYMAPEQARGQALTPACDVYAVGLLIYQMLTRQKPFFGATPLEVLQKQAHEPLPPLPERAAHSHLAQVMEIATRKQPQLRYRDAAQMLQALQRQGPIDPTRAPTNPGYEVHVQVPEEPLAEATRVSPALPAEGAAAGWAGGGEPPTAEALAPLETDLTRALEEPAPTGQALDLEQWQSTTRSTRALGAAAPTQAPLEEVPALIGRQEELGRVLGAAREALEAGAGRVLLCRGGAGVGKTRLMEEAARILAETSGLLTLRARLRWPDAEANEALGKLTGQLLGVGALVTRAMEPAALQGHLEQRLRAQGISLEARDLALLVEVLRASGAADPSPQRRSALVLARLTRLLLQVSARRPLLLLIEDLHQADATTVELLRRLCAALTRSGEGQRLLLCLTMRSEAATQQPEVVRLLQSLERGPQEAVTTIHASPLEKADAQRVVEAMLPVSPSLRLQIAELSHGNPGQILQCLRHLAQDHQLTQSGPEAPWRLRAPGALPSLPHDQREVSRLRVADVIGASRAPEAMQELLYRLAVLGPRVKQGLLRRMLELEQRPWPARLLERLLGELQRAAILQIDPDGAGDEALIFEDGSLPELLQQEVARSVGGARLHRSAARAKRAFYGGDVAACAHELAWHLERAGQPEEALPLWLKAARAAQARGDFQAATQRYQHLEARLDGPQGDRHAGLRRALWLGFGELNLRQGRHGPANIYLERLQEDLDAATLSDDPDHRAAQIRCALRLGELRVAQQRHGAAREHLERAWQLCVAGQEDALALEARVLLGELTLLERGQASPQGLHALEQGLEGLGEGHALLRARGLLHLSAAAVARGDLASAERWLAQARRLAEEQGDPGLQAAALSELGLAVLLQGRGAQGEGFLREALALYRELGDRAALALCLYRLGLEAWRRHALDDARELLERALAVQRDLALDEATADTLGLLGRVQEASGALSGAAAVYVQALALPIRRPPEMEAELQMRLGITALRRGQPDAARRSLETASQRFAALGDLPMQVQCLNLLAMAASWRQEHTQAEALLRQSLTLAARAEDEDGELFALLGLSLLGVLQPLPHGEASPQEALARAQALLRGGASPAMAPLADTIAQLARGRGADAISPDLPELHRAWLEQALR